jgi:hypothetical protein
MFFYFNDPEGPNLLVVTLAAVIVYFLSLAVYLFIFSKMFIGIKGLLLGIFTQLMIVSIFYFFLS